MQSLHLWQRLRCDCTRVPGNVAAVRRTVQLTVNRQFKGGVGFLVQPVVACLLGSN